MKTIVNTLIFAFIVLKGYSQDPTFTISPASLSAVNPAYTACYAGTTINLINRNQWTNIPGGFKTSVFTADNSFNKLWKKRHYISAGITIGSNNEGYNGFKIFSANPRIGVRVRVSPRTFFMVGGQFDYIRYQIDWSKFVFSDQLDEVYGPIYPTSFIKPGINSMDKKGYTFGFMFNQSAKHRSNRHHEWNFGVSAHHIFEDRSSFLNYEPFVPWKVDIFGQIYSIWEHSITKITLYYSQQGVLKTSLIGVDRDILDNHFFKNIDKGNSGSGQNLSLNLGCYYRSGYNPDAIILRSALKHWLGGLHSDWMVELGYSYDITVSQLSGSTAGTHEITLSLTYAPFIHLCPRNTNCNPANYYRPDMYWDPFKKNKIIK